MKTEISKIYITSASLCEHYRREVSVNSQQLQSDLFVAARASLGFLPDYAYRNTTEALFGKKPTVTALVTKSLSHLAKTFLQYDGERWSVPEQQFGNWQGIITAVPVLPIRIAAMLGQCPPPQQHGKNTDLPCYSALVGMENRVLTHTLGTHGLAEVHMHLNGTTEADAVWLDALTKPREVTRSLTESLQAEHTTGRKQSNKKLIIREQLLQVNPMLRSATDVLYLLQRAIVVRHAMARHLQHQAGKAGSDCTPRISDAPRPCVGCTAGEIKTRPERLSLHTILNTTYFSELITWSLRRHPVTLLVPKTKEPLLQQESMLLLRVLQELHSTTDEHLAQLLHVYLLLQATFMKLLVQQTTQVGFDQFQRIADNKLRDVSEEKYRYRYKQLYTNHPGGPFHLEGRFAPKENPAKLAKLLKSITKPWQQMTSKNEFANIADALPRPTGHPAPPPTLSLTAHFIKQLDNAPVSAAVRHAQYRLSLHKQGSALLTTLRRNPTLRHYVVSADAAANEMHAPPEVFAPVFRFLKQRGIARFTFHAGEDYQHLASGLRAMWEAITFLDLRPGDRIGHGTAVGIDPKLWMDRFGDSAHLTRQEWLDTLLFAYANLRDSAETNNHCASIADKIREQATLLYGDARPKITTLLAAWHMRTLDPTIAREEPLPTFGLSDYKHAELKRIRKARSEDLTAFTLFLRYHTDAKLKEKGGTLISVKSDAIPLPVLELLQREVIREMNRRHLAMEILPTSNVRISFYNDHAEHHVVRLLKKANTEADPRPIMCVGTDDTGIFSTCLKNEYAHIYRALRACDYSETDALAEIRQLIENAWAFHFPPNRAHPAAPKAVGFSLGR